MQETSRLSGTGGATGGIDYGIYFDTDVEVTAAGPATITMTGTGGTVSADGYQNRQRRERDGRGGGGGCDADREYDGFRRPDLLAAEDIILKPRTAATTIGLNGAAGTLNLTSTELDFFTPAQKFIIGDSARRGRGR